MIDAKATINAGINPVQLNAGGGTRGAKGGSLLFGRSAALADP